MAQLGYSEPCLYRKKLIELWNREFYFYLLLKYHCPNFPAVGSLSFCCLCLLLCVWSLCITTWDGQCGAAGPRTKCCWCSPASFLWVLNSLTQNVLLPWNSNTGGGRKYFIYFICMNRSVPISFDANMEPHKIASVSVQYINVCDHCMFVFDWSWIWGGLCLICLDYTLMTYRLLGMVKSL